jgi:hypothetical protein
MWSLNFGKLKTFSDISRETASNLVGQVTKLSKSTDRDWLIYLVSIEKKTQLLMYSNL